MTQQTPPSRRHSRVGLITPLAIFLIAGVAWTGWWFYLTRQIEDRLEARVESLRAGGWDVVYTGLTTTGWPFRARVEVEHAQFAAPSGFAVAAPRLAGETLAWNPDRWVIVAPEGLTVTRAEKGKLGIRATAIRASLSGLLNPYPNIAVELAEPVFTAHPGAEPFPVASAKRVELYLRPHLQPADSDGAGGQVRSAENSVDALFRLIEARGRPGGPVERFAQQGVLTLQVETVVEQAGRLSGANPAGVFSAWTAAGGRFTEVKGEMQAGESRATLTSPVLNADENGRLEGRLALQAVRPLPALAGLAGSRSAPAGAAGAAAATAAGAASAAEDINLTLVFQDGRTFLGPFALAPAPKLF